MYELLTKYPVLSFLICALLLVGLLFAFGTFYVKHTERRGKWEDSGSKPPVKDDTNEK